MAVSPLSLLQVWTLKLPWIPVCGSVSKGLTAVTVSLLSITENHGVTHRGSTGTVIRSPQGNQKWLATSATVHYLFLLLSTCYYVSHEYWMLSMPNCTVMGTEGLLSLLEMHRSAHQNCSWIILNTDSYFPFLPLLQPWNKQQEGREAVPSLSIQNRFSSVLCSTAVTCTLLCPMTRRL